MELALFSKGIEKLETECLILGYFEDEKLEVTDVLANTINALSKRIKAGRARRTHTLRLSYDVSRRLTSGAEEALDVTRGKLCPVCLRKAWCLERESCFTPIDHGDDESCGLRVEGHRSASAQVYFHPDTSTQETQLDLHLLPDATEVEEACQQWYTDISRDNPRISSARIWDEVINPKRSEVAQQLSTSKQNSCKRQLRDIYSARLSASLGSAAFDQLIDSFLQGGIYPLADALMNQEKIQAQQEISKRFPNRSIRDIALAIDDAGQAAAKRIATEESRDQLIKQKGLNNQLEAGFVRIDLGKHEEAIDLKGKCFWVPASVRHEVRKDAATGQTRYSFFVYGGVNIQPRINVVQGGNGPLGGNAVGGGAFNRNIDKQKFQDHHIASELNKHTKTL